MERSIEDLRSSVIALMDVCSKDTGHGKAQLVAYRRVLALIDGNETECLVEDSKLRDLWFEKLLGAAELIAYHDSAAKDYPLREWFKDALDIYSAHL